MEHRMDYKTLCASHASSISLNDDIDLAPATFSLEQQHIALVGREFHVSNQWAPQYIYAIVREDETLVRHPSVWCFEHKSFGNGNAENGLLRRLFGLATYMPKTVFKDTRVWHYGAQKVQSTGWVRIKEDRLEAVGPQPVRRFSRKKMHAANVRVAELVKPLATHIALAEEPRDNALLNTLPEFVELLLGGSTDYSTMAKMAACRGWWPGREHINDRDLASTLALGKELIYRKLGAVTIEMR